jgi:hypothetical protein
MMLRPASQLLIIGLTLLLSVQLTGLSCLEEWRIAESAGSLLDTHQITGVTTEPGELADDGCPCHMVFVSILSDASQPSHPVSLIKPGVPGTPPLMPPFVLFHPPLSL